MEKFDKSKPYSEVQGDSLAAYYQAPHYYDYDFNPVSPEDAGKPGTGGSYASQVEAGVEEALAKENSKKPLTLVDEFNPHTNSTADIEAARKRVDEKKNAAKPTKTAPTANDMLRKARGAELKKLNIVQLRHLVAEAGMTPVTGRGSAQANIKLLLDNTE